MFGVSNLKIACSGLSTGIRRVDDVAERVVEIRLDEQSFERMMNFGNVACHNPWVETAGNSSFDELRLSKIKMSR